MFYLATRTHGTGIFSCMEGVVVEEQTKDWDKQIIFILAVISWGVRLQGLVLRPLLLKTESVNWI